MAPSSRQPGTDRGSILDYAADTFTSHGTKVAFREVTPNTGVRPAGKPPDELTFAELEPRSNRIANKLIDLGYGDGDVLFIQLPNWLEFPVLHLGAVRAGLTTLPPSPSSPSTARTKSGSWSISARAI